MNEKELFDLLNLDESENLEFKEAKTRFNFENGSKSVCGYVIALANEGGGKLILGIKDKKPREIIGTNAFVNINKLKSDIYQRVNRRVKVDEFKIDKKRILVIQIPSRPIGVALDYKGQYLMRIGEELLPMTFERLQEISKENVDDYSSTAINSNDLYLLSKKAIITLRRLLKKSKRVSFNVDKLTDLELLKNLKLIQNKKLTIASLVLLGTEDSLQKYLPHSEVRFGYRVSMKYDRNQEMVIYKKAYLEYYNEIWDKINLRNHLVKIPKGMQLKEEYAFIEDSIREAINNAVIHRDYSESSSIIIQQTEDFFKITNPGGLPKGITLDNIFDETSPRNKLIADILFKCDFVETFGEGANKIYVNQVKYGKREPIYELSNNYFVTLKLESEISSLKLAKLIDKFNDKGLELNYAECKFLTDLIIHKKKVEILDYFIKNNILDSKGSFIGDFKYFNHELNVNTDTSMHGTMHGSMHGKKVLIFCKTEKSRDEIQKYLGLSNRDYFRKKVLNPLIEKELLELTIPDKPKSPNQKYRITKKGYDKLK